MAALVCVDIEWMDNVDHSVKIQYYPIWQPWCVFVYCVANMTSRLCDYYFSGHSFYHNLLNVSGLLLKNSFLLNLKYDAHLTETVPMLSC